LGANPDLESEVFGARSLEQRRIVGPVVLGDDRLVIVQVQEHRKPKLRPLAEVRDAVIAAVRRDQGSKAAKTAADVALARLAAGESLAAVAKTLGLTAEEPRFVGRADPSLTAEIRTAVFAGNRPTKAPVRGALTLDAGGAALYEVLSSKRDPNSANAELAKQRLSEALSRGGAGDVSAYVAELRRVAKVEKNPDAFE
jgi:peptidyl-prolyl cis-trans isomerase D